MRDKAFIEFLLNSFVAYIISHDYEKELSKDIYDSIYDVIYDSDISSMEKIKYFNDLKNTKKQMR